MLYFKVIEKWFQKYKHYFFTYKNGFFELTYLANTPESMVNSFDKMPFNQHDKINQILTTNNLFCKGILQYKKLEDDFWVMISKMEYKKNVSFLSKFDDTIQNNFYTLSLNIKLNANFQKLWKINTTNAIHQSNWTFFKPKTEQLNCCLKNTEAYSITIFFTEEWMKQNLLNDQMYLQSNLYKFIYSSKEYIVQPTNLKKEQPFVDYFKSILIDEKNIDTKKIHQLKTKIEVLELIELFAKEYKNEEMPEYDEVNKTFFQISFVEDYLIKHIHEPFMGIPLLASHFVTSESKLKSLFKQYTGKSIFQYFREKQMEEAYILLFQKKYTITQIASKMGYTNASKFTEAFKAQYQILPSTLLHDE